MTSSGTGGASGHPESAVEPVAAILKMIREGERFVVCSHAGPDWDAVGSLLAIGMLKRNTKAS